MKTKKRKEKVFIAKSAKTRFLPTNTGLMTNILGVSSAELLSSGTKPDTFFGAPSSLCGAHFSFVGTSSVLKGQGPKMPTCGVGPVLREFQSSLVSSIVAPLNLNILFLLCYNTISMSILPIIISLSQVKKLTCVDISLFKF